MSGDELVDHLARTMSLQCGMPEWEAKMAILGAVGEISKPTPKAIAAMKKLGIDWMDK